MVPGTIRWRGPWLAATRTTSLQRVANRPIICHVLDAMLEAGIADVLIVTPPEVTEETAHSVELDGPAGLTVQHLADAGAGQALLGAAEFVGDCSCVVHRADGLLGQPILAMLEAYEGERRDAVLMVEDNPAERLRLVSGERAGERREDEAPPRVEVAGACALGPGVLARVAALDRISELLDLHTLVEQLSRDGANTQTLVARRWRRFAGDASDLLDLNRRVLETLQSEAVPDPSDGNRFEGPILIDPTARVSSSVIVGPVMIGAGAVINDSYIGPHTSIAERVRIEGAEIERSIVLADASVLHVGGRLVASVVGRHARVFRDFSMPRALRLQVSDGDEVALC